MKLSVNLVLGEVYFGVFMRIVFFRVVCPVVVFVHVGLSVISKPWI